MKTPIFYLSRTNQTVSKPLFAFALLISLLSCSSSDDGGGSPIIPTPQPITENVWTLDNYKFTRNVSAQSNTTYNNGNPFTQVTANSNIMSGNGKFRFCKLVAIFNTSTEGTYTIKSQNTTAGNTLEKYLQISCTASDGGTNGAIYQSIDTTVPATVAEVDGKFVITISQDVTLTKVTDDDFDGPPTMVFKCNKVQ